MEKNYLNISAFLQKHILIRGSDIPTDEAKFSEYNKDESLIHKHFMNSKKVEL